MTLGIEKIYLWIAEDEEGEGVMAIRDSAGNWMPMIGADMDRVNSLRPAAEAQANETGKAIKLVRFDQRTLVESYTPGEETQP